MNGYAYYEYLKISGERLFTVIALPQREGKFPTVVCRSPYVKSTVMKSEEELAQNHLESSAAWLRRGYAVVFQHCKGQGKSSGEFVPYVHEREDGLGLRAWIREQAFYNGEFFLTGGSYTASLHYATAPFEEDILGAAFEVQDSERYRLWYRNGQMRKGHANWHFDLYKANCSLSKNFNIHSFARLPLSDLSECVLGDRAEDFEQMLKAPNPTDDFWSTRFGGVDTKGATDNANIPILLTTGYNDFYVGGVFKMWNSMSEETRKKCALLVSPYDHGDGYNKDRGLYFENGKRAEQFGSCYQIDWFDNIRKGSPTPIKKGVITYYRAFENKWQEDFYKVATKEVSLPLGEGEAEFIYDPKKPTAFCGEGIFASEENDAESLISISTKPQQRDIFIKGQMRARLAVSSNCEDTSFYIRISIKKKDCTYVLRHDITSLCYQLGAYKANETVYLDFCFDEHAFLLKKGECLQIDIASTDNNTYVSHTNNKGPYHLQTTAKAAKNKVYLDKSQLILPIE